MSLANPIRNLTSNLRCLSFGSSWLNASPSVNKQAVDPLKRPVVNAWSVYYAENFSVLKKNNPNMISAEIMKILSKEWGTMPENKKRPYVLAQKQKMTAFKAAVENLSDEQKYDIKQGKKQAKEAKHIRKLRKELSDLTRDKPKFNNAYNAFIAQEFKLNPGESVVGGYVKTIAVKWKNMSAFQKKPFDLISEKSSMELQQWKEKTLQDGRDVQIKAIKKEIAHLKE